jgi:hypothetical protein
MIPFMGLLHPNALIYDLIQHPYFQRLRRISQMGLSYLVYPGANHTRFHRFGLHASDAKAVDVLRLKALFLKKRKMRSILLFYCTMILGTDLFCTLWKSIVEDVHHEISLLFMHQLNTN